MMKEKKKNLITKQRNMCKVFAEKRIKSKQWKSKLFISLSWLSLSIHKQIWKNTANILLQRSWQMFYSLEVND